MIYFHPTQLFTTNLEKDLKLKDYTLKKLEDLKLRTKIDKECKKPKLYHPGTGIWILKLTGRGVNSRVILQEIFDHGQEGIQLFLIRNYIPQSKYIPHWRTIVLPMIAAGKYLDKNPPNPEEYQAAIDWLDLEVNKPAIPKPLLPISMSQWLHGFGFSQKFTIYESPNWANKQNYIGNYIGELFSLIKKVFIESDFEKKKIEVPERNLYMASNSSVIVIYEQTGILSEDSNNIHEVFFLHNWSKKNDTNEINKITEEATNYEPFQKIKNAQYDRDIISQGAYRGYPGLIFQKEAREVWERIQKNSNKSNLALSPEQEELLKDFNFPSFINGQAGSGKSEMLMYLFAELCFRKEADDIKGEIVFLTENEELLERALLDTMEKLAHNSQYVEYNFNHEKIKGHFYPFRRFIREKLVEEEDRSLFKEAKYVTFSKFKQLYEDSLIKKGIKRKYPAEIAWFIIMTYIRGHDVGEEELTPERFESLPKKDKSFVDKETYAEVYEKIWKRFYKIHLEQTEEWDRLSLVRHILNLYSELPKEKKYSVIVCDEAQDFTRLELQLLIKLSEYTNFDLGNLNQVPITFAGDPFQTVNPTGFNLTQIKTLFYQEITRNLKVNFKIDELVSNLHNNYRSSPEIVNLANTIQYIRYKFLEFSDLSKPQTPRKISNKKKPNLFQIDNSNKNELKEKLQYAVFISPCNHGEENNYKVQDSWLDREFVLKSAALAKGSEYQVVAIYKFGEDLVNEFGEDFFEKLVNEDGYYMNLTQGDQFKLNFFFNKLYVALTRAQEEIYILDSPLGIKCFWKIMKSASNVTEIKESVWSNINAVEIYQEGLLESLGKIDFKTILQNAKNDEDSGISYEDPQKMRDAARWYEVLSHDLGDTQYNDAPDFCIAKALEFEKKYKRAGDKYKNCKLKRKGFDALKAASKCYWIGGYWSDLLELHEDASETELVIRNTVASLMLNKGFDIQSIITYNNRIQIAIQGDKTISGKIEWEDKFYEQLTNYIYDHKGEYSGRLSELAEAIDKFKDKREPIEKLIGELYYEDRNYELAYNRWIGIEFVDNPKFWKSAAEVHHKKDINKEVYYLDKLKEDERITELYLERSKDIKNESLSIVTHALFKNLNEKNAKELIRLNNSKKSWKDLWKFILNYKNNKRASLFSKNYILSFINADKLNRSQWQFSTFINFVESLMEATFESYEKMIIDLNILESSKNKNNSKKIEQIEKRLNNFFAKNGWMAQIFNGLIRGIPYSNIEPKRISNILSSGAIKYLKLTAKSKNNQIDFLEISSFLDKATSDAQEKHHLYLDFENFMLRSNDFSFEERTIIEHRFWKISYEILSKNEKDEHKIWEALNAYEKKYDLIKFRTAPPKLNELKEMERFPTVDYLRNYRQKSKSIISPNKNDQETMENQNYSEILGKLEKQLENMSKQYEKITHQNDQLMDELKKSREEKDKLQEKNMKLTEKLLNFLDNQ